MDHLEAFTTWLVKQPHHQRAIEALGHPSSRRVLLTLVQSAPVPTGQVARKPSPWKVGHGTPGEITSTIRQQLGRNWTAQAALYLAARGWPGMRASVAPSYPDDRTLQITVRSQVFWFGLQVELDYSDEYRLVRAWGRVGQPPEYTEVVEGVYNDQLADIDIAFPSVFLRALPVQPEPGTLVAPKANSLAAAVKAIIEAHDRPLPIVVKNEPYMDLHIAWAMDPRVNMPVLAVWHAGDDGAMDTQALISANGSAVFSVVGWQPWPGSLQGDSTFERVWAGNLKDQGFTEAGLGADEPDADEPEDVVGPIGEEPLTTVLAGHPGIEVLAKTYKDEVVGITFANRTQAQNRLDALGAGWDIYQWGRPFYVGRRLVPEAPDWLQAGARIESIENPEWGAWVVDGPARGVPGTWEIHSVARGPGHARTLDANEAAVHWRPFEPPSVTPQVAAPWSPHGASIPEPEPPLPPEPEEVGEAGPTDRVLFEGNRAYRSIYHEWLGNRGWRLIGRVGPDYDPTEERFENRLTGEVGGVVRKLGDKQYEFEAPAGWEQRVEAARQELHALPSHQAPDPGDGRVTIPPNELTGGDIVLGYYAAEIRVSQVTQDRKHLARLATSDTMRGRRSIRSSHQGASRSAPATKFTPKSLEADPAVVDEALRSIGIDLPKNTRIFREAGEGARDSFTFLGRIGGRSSLDDRPAPDPWAQPAVTPEDEEVARLEIDKLTKQDHVWLGTAARLGTSYPDSGAISKALGDLLREEGARSASTRMSHGTAHGYVTLTWDAKDRGIIERVMGSMGRRDEKSFQAGRESQDESDSQTDYWSPGGAKIAGRYVTRFLVLYTQAAHTFAARSKFKRTGAAYVTPTGRYVWQKLTGVTGELGEESSGRRRRDRASGEQQAAWDSPTYGSVRVVEGAEGQRATWHNIYCTRGCTIPRFGFDGRRWAKGTVPPEGLKAEVIEHGFGHLFGWQS